MTTLGRIYLGLPAYNEEIALPRLLLRIESLVKSSQLAITVVVYNDGSTDQTGTIAAQWQQRMPLVLLDCPQNKGLGVGLRALIDYAVATGKPDDILVIMDCDDTHHPDQFPVMLAALDRGHDIVIASRYRHGSRIAGVALHRRLLSLGAATLFKLLHWCRGVRDYTCGFRGYRVGLLQRARTHYGERLVEERGFACMVELLLKLNRVGASMCEVPIDLRYDLKQGASKMDVGGNALRLLRKLVAWRVRGLK